MDKLKIEITEAEINNPELVDAILIKHVSAEETTVVFVTKSDLFYETLDLAKKFGVLHIEII